MKFLIDESPLVVQPTLAKHLGLNRAIVLQQLHYWLSNPKAGVWHDGHKWIHNTYEEWQANFPFWSIDTVKRTILSLEEDKIIVSAQFAPSNYDKTKSYRIDEEVLAPILDAICTKDDGNMPQSIQRLLPETTTDIPVTPKVVTIPLSIENAIYAGLPVSSLPKDNDYMKRAEVTAKSIKDANKYALAVNLMMAFQKTRGIALLYEDQKTNKAAVVKMISAGVQPKHVEQAVNKLAKINYDCTTMYSIAKTAIGIANPMPGKKTVAKYVTAFPEEEAEDAE